MSRILIVADDSAEMRWLVTSALERQFDEVIQASDGGELLEQLVHCAQEHAAAEVVVVTDLRMPRYTGLDVIEAYAELAYYPTTVVMTSFPGTDVCARVSQAGAVMLPKPFGARDLRRVIEEASRR